MKRNLIILMITIFSLARVSSQSTDLEVKATVKSQTSVEITRGMPVVLDFRINSLLGITYEEVLQDIPDSLKQDPELLQRLDSVFQPLKITEEGIPWHQNVLIRYSAPGQKKFREPLLHTLHPLPAAGNVLGPSEALHLYLGIDPEITRIWNPGVVQLTLGIPVLETRDTLWTKPVRITVLPRKLKKASQYNAGEQYELADYWLLRNECARAEPIAQKLYLADTSSISCTVLMARVEECRNHYLAAHALYSKAMNQFLRQPGYRMEPPETLVEKITELQERILFKTP